MKNYKVQGMTHEAYNLMMTGSHGWSPSEFWIEANSKEEAYRIAVEQYPDLVINEYVESEEEIAQRVAIREEEERKEKEKRERKAEKELEQAKQMGLTLDVYREHKRLEKNKKRHEAIFEKLKKEIEYEEKKIKEYEEKMKKIAERG